MRYLESDDYNELYTKLQVVAQVAAIKQGDSPEDKTEGIMFFLLEKIISALMKENPYEAATQVHTLYMSIGRTSEAAVWPWNATGWVAQEQHIKADCWQETKTSKLGWMDFGPSSQGSMTDIMIHMMAA